MNLEIIHHKIKHCLPLTCGGPNDEQRFLWNMAVTSTRMIAGSLDTPEQQMCELGPIDPPRQRDDDGQPIESNH